MQLLLSRLHAWQWHRRLRPRLHLGLRLGLALWCASCVTVAPCCLLHLLVQLDSSWHRKHAVHDVCACHLRRHVPQRSHPAGAGARAGARAAM